MEQAAKQRAFEQAMLSDVPVEKREAIWQRAQHQAVSVHANIIMVCLDHFVSGLNFLFSEKKREL